MTIDLAPLLQFFGYGTFDAPFWFIGQEEGTGPDNTRATRLENYRRRSEQFTQPTMDLVEAQSILGHAVERNTTPAWRNMARFTRLVRRGPPLLEKGEVAHEIPACVGRLQPRLPRRACFLGEALPIPLKGRGDRLGHQLLQELWGLSHGVYKRAFLPARAQQWRDLIIHHEPEVVVFYGGGREAASHAFPEGNWQALCRREGSTSVEVAPSGATLLFKCHTFANQGVRNWELMTMAEAIAGR